MNTEEQTNKIIELQNAIVKLAEDKYAKEFQVAILRVLAQMTYSEELYDTPDNVGMVHSVVNAFKLDKDSGAIVKIPTYVYVTHDLFAVAELAVATGVESHAEADLVMLSANRKNFNKSVAALVGYEYSEPNTENVVKH